MAVWDITVHSANGTPRHILTPESPVDEFRWATRGDGDCLEASIVGRDLDLRPRDVVHIRTAGNPSSSILTSRYWGWVVQAPARSSGGLSEARLVGGSLRLRELWTAHTEVGSSSGQDVSRSAAVAMSPAVPLLPEPRWPEDFPVLGFVAGLRQPRLETRAETLDAFAAMLPEFVVPVGQTYAYDGVTFNPGDTVPGVTWGVRAVNGVPGAAIFMRRPMGVWSAPEVAGKLLVVWEPVSAEEVVDEVRVVLFDQPQSETLVSRFGIRQDSPYLPVGVVAHAWVDPAAMILAETPYAAQRVVSMPVMEGLEVGAWSGVTLVAANMVNVGHTSDGDTTTYSHNSGSVMMTWGRNAATDTVAVRITYSSHVELRLWVTIGVIVPLPGNRGVVYEATLKATAGEQTQVVMLLPRVQQSQLTPVNVQLRTNQPLSVADQVRIYEIEPLRVAQAMVAGVARSHFRLPRPAAATVTVPNSIVAPQPNAMVTLADSSTLSGKADTWEYSVTKAGGLTTVVRVGHAMPAAAASEASALTRRLHAVALAARRS